jgi:SH3-like domain-containing protein
VPFTSTATRVPGSRRARVVVLWVALVVMAVPATAAARPPSATFCAAQVTMYETPGGAKVGVLHRGDHVRVVAAGERAPWWRVAAAFGTRGWLRSSALCGHRR